MNREIKFRVFCETHNRWEFYTLGDLICGSTTSENGEGEFKSESWGQYTGLHDKNGKEAYFDDMVRFPFSLPPFDGTNVKWHTGVIGMDEYGHSCIMVADEKFHIQGVLKGEVIGSIHDLKTE